MKQLLTTACLVAMLLIGGLIASPSRAAETRGNASGLSDYQLRIWNSEAFQRRFTESYLSQTEVEPTVTADERKVLLEIKKLIQNEQLDEALEKLRKEREKDSSAIFDFFIANIHFEREQWEQAIAEYDNAIDKFANFQRAWNNLGKIHVRQGNHQEAVECLTKVIQLGAGDAITYGLLGFSYQSLERPIAAESAYRQAVLMDSETMDWKLGLARSFFQQRRFAAAAAFLDRLIEADPDRAQFWLIQGNAYIGMDKPTQAAENFEFVDALGESTPASLNTLGDIYVNQELYELAVDAYGRSLAMQDTGGTDRAIRAAKVIAARGANDEVRDLVKRIEETRAGKLSDEERKDLLKLRARIAVAQGAGGREVEILKEIVELDPLDGEALMLLGQHYRREGDVERAVFYFERAAKIEGHEADAKVRMAQIRVKQGDLQKAISLLKSAQQIKPRENIQDYLEQVERAATRG
jgi:tetratricopeptide (TPR) repeat protein